MTPNASTWPSYAEAGYPDTSPPVVWTGPRPPSGGSATRPAGWTTLLNHLRSLGHDDAAIQAAGLARLSRRGTLIDHFRDRVMLAIRNEHGQITGFIGRARPGADPRTPKYFNSPDSPIFTKGDLLFGLYESRRQLTHGAIPVLVEGPFDAIAVTTADPRRYAGVAPCGTAFTSHQAEALARNTELRRTGILVALDGDPAGQTAAVKAYDILRSHTAGASAVDPARRPRSRRDPPGRRPSRLVRRSSARRCPWPGPCIDAQLDQMGGPARPRRRPARRDAHRRRPHRPPAPSRNSRRHPVHHRWPDTHRHRRDLRPVEHPELPAIARILPADTIGQISRTADRTRSEHFEIIAAIAEEVGRRASIPKEVDEGGASRRPAAPGAGPPVRIAAASLAAERVDVTPSRTASGRIAPRRRRPPPRTRPS